jgi:serine/threonine protein kinase
MFETLGHYKILDRIGAGGIGEVFRARDTRVGRTVAIRVIASEFLREAATRERFLRDARAAVTLSHPNIAALYEIGEDQGQQYLVCEYVPGETLRAAIGGRPLNPRRALEFAIQIADALADGHAEGIVHRDLKPENIIITPKGSAKILDFGLSAWTAGGAARERTARATATAAPIYGEVVGRTVPYMSPEQAQGETIDSRTDIFSLGVILFEMLTGKVPFGGPTPSAVALQIVQSDASPPSAVNSAVPRDLDPIVGKMLAKAVDRRYESVATAAAELRSVAAILDVRSGTSEPPVIARMVRRRRSWTGWLVAVILLVIVGLIWLATRQT